jgi:hypothetical protein
LPWGKGALKFSGGTIKVTANAGRANSKFNSTTCLGACRSVVVGRVVLRYRGCEAPRFPATVCDPFLLNSLVSADRMVLGPTR